MKDRLGGRHDEIRAFQGADIKIYATVRGRREAKQKIRVEWGRRVRQSAAQHKRRGDGQKWMEKKI